jgi:mannose/fructose-specific phosphotransferase system component IIA
MAIQKSITTQHGIHVENAYHRVEAVSLLGKTKLRFLLRIYSDKNKPSFHEEEFIFDYDLSGGNPLSQAYEHLKTLPEFEGAVDC